MDVIGIVGPRIRLVPLDRERHLENYVRWFNDPEITRYLLQFLPLSRPEEEKFFERAAENEASIVWAIHDENDRHIGGTGLDRINWKERSAVSGIVIGEKDAWGKGYGTEVMQVRTTYAFEQLGLHRVESECFADNVASIRCLEEHSLSREGRLPARRRRASEVLARRPLARRHSLGYPGGGLLRGDLIQGWRSGVSRKCSRDRIFPQMGTLLPV